RAVRGQVFDQRYRLRPPCPPPLPPPHASWRGPVWNCVLVGSSVRMAPGLPALGLPPLEGTASEASLALPPAPGRFAPLGIALMGPPETKKPRGCAVRGFAARAAETACARCAFYH